MMHADARAFVADSLSAFSSMRHSFQPQLHSNGGAYYDAAFKHAVDVMPEVCLGDD